MTEQPLALTVVNVEQVVVESMEPLALNTVGAHCTVTCNAVFEDVHDDAEDEEEDEAEDAAAAADDDDEYLCEALVDASEYDLLSGSSLPSVRS